MDTSGSSSAVTSRTSTDTATMLLTMGAGEAAPRPSVSVFRSCASIFASMPRGTSLGVACATAAGCRCVPMCASICRSVGKSKMSVSGSSIASPSRAVSRLRNSTAPRESSPASMSGASIDTSGSSSAVTSRTNAVLLLCMKTSGADEANRGALVIVPRN